MYKKPTGYFPEQRRTARITPLLNRQLIIQQYKQDYSKVKKLESTETFEEKPTQSKERQLREWYDTNALHKKEFLKDPHRTVFVARLHYSASELDVSKTFTQFGVIESIRVVRHHKTSQSRGYAFVVFESETDAKSCVRQLAPTGIVVKTETDASRRTLVDMERGRLFRSWLPMRLGGGLGGRHYTQPSSHAREASAAASGRRLNLSSNPYQQSAAASRTHKRPTTDRYSGSNKRQATDSEALRVESYYKPSEPVSLPYTPTASNHSVQAARGADSSIKDKYAKYQSVSSESRSSRTIRR